MAANARSTINLSYTATRIKLPAALGAGLTKYVDAICGRTLVTHPSPTGGLSIDGPGGVAEWMVLMRRLPERAEPVVTALDRALGNRKNPLRKRARRRRIVEGHGDLRPQHVCLRPRPVFFDCLEFDRSLRLLDPVDEIAYLAMECEYRGTPRVGEIFYETYAEVTGDEVDPDLAAFYKAHRALVRARLALRHRTVPGGGSRREWAERAATYVSLAGTYAERLG